MERRGLERGVRGGCGGERVERGRDWGREGLREEGKGCGRGGEGESGGGERVGRGGGEMGIEGEEKDGRVGGGQ